MAATLPASSSPPSIPSVEYSSQLLFFLNGKKVVCNNVQPDMTLLQYLRSTDVGLTGTKLGCGEGGCGACTVMVSRYDTRTHTVQHRSINACLAPLASVDGAHVITVEGIGASQPKANSTTRPTAPAAPATAPAPAAPTAPAVAVALAVAGDHKQQDKPKDKEHAALDAHGGNSNDGRLHVVQERMYRFHGAQCGFCTPGIVMAMYTFFRNNPKATKSQVEEAMDGNLCRCTGYRPIYDAAKSLCVDAKSACGEGGACCRAVPKSASKALKVAVTVDMESMPSEEKSIIDDKAFRTVETCSCAKAQPYTPYDPAQEPAHLAFPEYLTTYEPQPLKLAGDLVTWYRPTSLAQLLTLKAQFPKAKLVVGNTEVGIETKFKHLDYPVQIYTGQVPQLTQMGVESGGLRLGASVTLSDLRSFLQSLLPTSTAGNKSTASTPRDQTINMFLKQIRWFSSTQIRNAACIGGNIVTASPISDLNPLFQASNAMFIFQSTNASSSSSTSSSASPTSPKGARRREVGARAFFLDYRKVDMTDSEVLVSVFVPFAVANQYQQSFKQAKRREDDISIVTAGMSVSLSNSAKADEWRVTDCSLSFGGMSKTTLCAPHTQAFLLGQPWSAKTIRDAYALLNKDLPVPPNTPGGMEEYRSTLAASFLYKFFVYVCAQLKKEGKPSPALEAGTEGCHLEVHRAVSSGKQEYQVPDDRSLVGAAMEHSAGRVHVTGEAQYTDDIPDTADTLHAALVLSTEAHALIESIDVAAAKAVKGFVAFYTAKDVPGTNHVGDIVHDEELFAEKEVMHVGHPVGIVVASSQSAAARAAHLVKIKYQALPAILSIQDAIEAKSFITSLGDFHKLECGDIDAGFKESDVVVEGEFSMGGQEHFYLETHNALVIPGELNEFTVVSSTQNPANTQEFVAEVLGVTNAKVVAQVKRMGGGFGGKETRSINVACYTAVAAYQQRRPVRLTLDRDVDMLLTGGRHPFHAKYRVGVTKAGKLKALDVQLYSNAGFSMDLSMPVMDRALFHIDNTYKFPNLRAVGRLCKTHMPSNTAFRGFGGPQGMLINETLMDHVARTLRMPKHTLRQLNMYTDADRTHFNQELKDCHIRMCLDQVRERANMEQLEKEVEAFNKKNPLRKRGVAVVPTKFGISFTAAQLNQGGALVHVYRDGSVLVSHGGTEMGQGLHTKMMQVAAQAFGIPMSKVSVHGTATDKVANTSATAASFSSDINGYAVLNACEQILERLKPVRAEDPNRTWEALCRAAWFQRINLSANGYYKVPSVGYNFVTASGTPFRYFTFGASCALVEVDVLTGDFHIVAAHVLMDLGCSLNPVIDVGQVEGAFAQGVGLFTMEELVWGDKQHKWVRPGALFTRGPGAYKLPGFNDVPIDFRVHLLKNAPNRVSLHSSKAVGEPPLFMASSVFFAIKEAIAAHRAANGLGDGYFLLNSPATPERIRMACMDSIASPFCGPNPEKFQPKGSF